MLSARHTRVHSAWTFFRPRKLNLRNPITSLIQPTGASAIHLRRAYRLRPMSLASFSAMRAFAGYLSGSGSTPAEAQFKTLKYHPSFPGRFGDQGQAKTFCRSFFRWYNAEHRHGGISMLTPEQVHFGNADQVIAGRKSVPREAWAAHPERFVRGVPKPKPLPEAVFINPPIPSLTTQDIAL